MKRPAVIGSQTQDTSVLSRQCSTTETRQPDNHQSSQSSVLLLNASVAHLAEHWRTPSNCWPFYFPLFSLKFLYSCICMAHLSPTQQYSTLKFECGNMIKIHNVSTLRLSHVMSLCHDITCNSLPGSPPLFLSHTLSRANYTERHTPQ